MPQIDVMSAESISKLAVDTRKGRQRLEVENDDPNAQRKYVELVCLNDGGKHIFFDDGPWPVLDTGARDPDWSAKPPTGSRQNLLKQVRKRDAYGFAVWATSRAGLRVFDHVNQQFVSIAVIDDAWLERSRICRNERDTIHERQKAELEKKNREAREATEASETRMQSAFAGFMERFAAMMGVGLKGAGAGAFTAVPSADGGAVAVAKMPTVNVPPPPDEDLTRTLEAQTAPMAGESKQKPARAPTK